MPRRMPEPRHIERPEVLTIQIRRTLAVPTDPKATPVEPQIVQIIEVYQ